MIQESRLLFGHCPEDSRLKEVADLLRLQPSPREHGKQISVPYEAYENMLNIRANLYTTAIAAVRALVEYDRHHSCFFSAEPPRETTSEGLEAAVRAAAPHVRYGGDWGALLMLLRERGTKISEAQMVRMVRRFAPEAPQCTRQILTSAFWDTNRRHFPYWLPEGIRRDKFDRHWAVASAALPCLQASAREAGISCKSANLH